MITPYLTFYGNCENAFNFMPKPLVVVKLCLHD